MSFDFAAALGGKFPGGLPPKLQPPPLGIVRDPFDIEESALTKAFGFNLSKMDKALKREGTLVQGSDLDYFRTGKAKEFGQGVHGGFSKFIEHFRQHGWQEFLDLLKIWNRYASHLPKEATSLPQEADFVQAFRRFRGKFTSVSPDFFIIIFDTFAPEFIVSLISDRAPQVDRRSLVESIVMGIVIGLTDEEMSYCIQSIPTFLKNFHIDLSTRSLLKKSTENKVPSMVHMWRVLLRGIHTRKNMQFFIQHSDMKMLNAITKADFTRPLPAGIYEASAEALGVGHSYHVYLDVARNEDAKKFASKFFTVGADVGRENVRIFIIPTEFCPNTSVGRKVLPLERGKLHALLESGDLGSGEALFELSKDKNKYVVTTSSILTSNEKLGFRSFLEYKMFLDRLFVFCRNAILDPTERIVELIDKDDAVSSTKLRQTPESKDSSVIMPFTFPVNGLTERSSGTVAYDVRLQVRNATLGWPVVLPSGHLPLRETLMRNQSFFPTFPGAPVVSVGLYHTFTSAEGRILRESSVVWPMTDVASDLGFYLSFVQSILGGIEYILLHDSHRKDIADGLKQLAQDIQEKMTSFVADYEPEDDQRDEQKKRNEAFASEIRETLRVFNILSPTLQLRSKTHALPEDMDREVLQYSPQRLINIGGVLQHEPLHASESNEEKLMMVEIPLRK